MKAVINEKETPVKHKYPMLMKAKATGSIALFLSNSTSVFLHASPYSEKVTGDYCADVDNTYWEPFTGSITLSND
jgi:hypothetical protein